ncbi:MAG: division/cell wall cluster transcriptional repressor MraZ [Chromatiales bacterium]|nr:division/cell wall cluster transcriptional repressor MraZ [Chromatiales bacterium]
MFRGRKDLSLDGKGRITMPAKYRERMLAVAGGSMVITIDPSKCLLIYPLPMWEEVEAKLAAVATQHEANRKFTRFIVHNAEEVEMDAQGRFVIPPLLRQYAKLDKKVVMAGAINKIELWDEARYLEQQLDWPDAADLPPEIAGFAL